MTTRIALLPALFAFSAALPASAQAPRLFDAPRFLDAAQGGSVRELGDFDGDLDIDLIHVLGQSQTEWSGFRLLTNDGDSRFTAGPSITFPAPGGSFATEFCARDEPHAGDFDGDGNLDIAFDHYKNVFTTDSVGGLEVYFGDGAGGFAAPINTGVATASSFVVGQADLDPAQEIAMWGQDVTGARFAWWLDWNGVAFQASPGLPLAHSGDTGGGLVEAEALDLDGDGIDDLVGRSTSFLNLRVLATAGGQFTYGQVVALPAGFATINSTFVGGDLDADGDPDPAVIQRQFGPTTYDPIFLVHRNDGGFLVQQAPQTVTLPTSVYTGYTWQVRDWNEDGLNDALEYSSEIAQVAGDGALGLQFAGAVRIASNYCEAGAGDLDGDGHLDVAASDVVYLGDGRFKNVPPGPADLDITLADTCAIAEDREGDGDLDVLAPSGGSAGFYKVNDAAGGFSNGSATLPVLPPSHFLSSARTFADFSFDGRRDWLMGMHKQVSLLVTEFVEMVWLIDDGAGGYTLAGGVTPPGVQIPLPSAPLKHFPVGDIDGDGDQDLLTSSGHWENNGIGFGGAKIASFTGDAQDALDFDGDGDLDILVLNLDGPGYSTRLLRQSGGTFTSQVLSPWPNRALAFFRDLDADGDPDIVAGMIDGAITAVHENVGGAAVDRGTLAMQLQRELTVAVHDVDGDGLKDLLGVGTGKIGNNPPDDIGPAWFRRVGPGLIYATPEIYKAFYGVIGLFDADGDSDVDSVGMYSYDGQEHVEPASGKIRQFGTATPGSGGIRPILGASGPMWTGSTTAVERVRRGLGGAPMVLIYGFNEVAIADFPLLGLTLYTNPFVIFGTFLLSGPPGVPGVGAFDFALPTGPELAGLRLYKQAFVIDLAAPTGLACQTNGLELVWGS